jgi:glycosyltransferase involved in cell wall biosynthesis
MNQTLRPNEIIIVDDASNDSEALQILSAIEKKPSSINIKVVRQKKNQGPSTTRNRGWNEATGELIAFIDSDDMWTPQKIKRQAEFMDQTMCGACIHYFDHQKTRISGKVMRRSLWISNILSPSCLMVRRSISSRFDESFRFCEDHELAISLSFETELIVIPEVLTVLGRPPASPGGLSAQKWKMRLGQIALYWKHYKTGNLGLIQALALSGLSLAKHLVKALLFR